MTGKLIQSWNRIRTVFSQSEERGRGGRARLRIEGCEDSWRSVIDRQVRILEKKSWNMPKARKPNAWQIS